jgi:hypothetical protein
LSALVKVTYESIIFSSALLLDKLLDELLDKLRDNLAVEKAEGSFTIWSGSAAHLGQCLGLKPWANDISNSKPHSSHWKSNLGIVGIDPPK